MTLHCSTVWAPVPRLVKKDKVRRRSTRTHDLSVKRTTTTCRAEIRRSLQIFGIRFLLNRKKSVKTELEFFADSWNEKIELIRIPRSKEPKKIGPVFFGTQESTEILLQGSKKLNFLLPSFISPRSAPSYDLVETVSKSLRSILGTYGWLQRGGPATRALSGDTSLESYISPINLMTHLPIFS